MGNGAGCMRRESRCLAGYGSVSRSQPAASAAGGRPEGTHDRVWPSPALAVMIGAWCHPHVWGLDDLPKAALAGRNDTLRLGPAIHLEAAIAPVPIMCQQM